MSGKPKGRIISSGNPNPVLGEKFKANSGSGRVKGSRNKVNVIVKGAIADFVALNIVKIQAQFELLDAKEKLQFLVTLLPYVISREPNSQPEAPEGKVIPIEGRMTEDVLKSLQAGEAKVVK